jgi:hypothetical protein
VYCLLYGEEYYGGVNSVKSIKVLFNSACVGIFTVSINMHGVNNIK